MTMLVWPARPGDFKPQISRRYQIDGHWALGALLLVFDDDIKRTWLEERTSFWDSI